ncbi:hypothetical protein [Ruegeria lacuscaerulensis]|uniref:hypothetical protein n=1 Tax=Ruegeria lacuscaerulensis TaxID=55218 RepID=UPI00147BB046|nr:hypothetical protein [Ruegeria lacuscaerulensis]
MPRPKTPLGKAILTGAAKKDPQRYRGRNEPEGLGELGVPPDYLNETEQAVWRAFADELPWLVHSDRALLESACILRARVQLKQDLSAALLRELRLHVSALGGCPTNRSNIQVPEAEAEHNPFDRFA